jgi:uncharacterized protein YciI
MKGYAAGYLLASGPRIPPTDGIVLAQAPTLDEMREFLNRDPFNKAGVAEYEIIEFTTVKSDTGLKDIVK